MPKERRYLEVNYLKIVSYMTAFVFLMSKKLGNLYR